MIKHVREGVLICKEQMRRQLSWNESRDTHERVQDSRVLLGMTLALGLSQEEVRLLWEEVAEEVRSSRLSQATTIH